MKCYQCNVEIPEGSVFCPYCGKRIDVPRSLKCPQCNLDVPEGTEYCPNCGSHIGTPRLAICSKCGTEIPKGGAFCPNCGNPSHIENSHQRYGISSMKEATDKYVSKAEELIQQSKKYINEKVQPQFDERVKEFKSVDWEEKKKESVSSLKGFFSNKDRLHKATIWIAIISVLWFFIINDGFSASWMWWIMTIMVVGAAFCKVKSINNARKLFAATLFIGFLLILYNPNIENDTYGIEGEHFYETTKNEPSVVFISEMDVRTYLDNHRFASSDGYTLSFRNNAYEMSVNGRVLSSYSDVNITSTNSATIHTHGPFNTTFKLTVLGGNGVIKDSNDGELYYSK